MIQPTDKQREEAINYIAKRIDTELAVKIGLRNTLLSAADRIIAIGMKYNISPSKFKFSANKALNRKIDIIIAELRETIYDMVERASVYDREDEDKDEIIAYVNSEQYGKTFSERNRIYCDRFKFELEAAIAAALLSGQSESTVKSNVRSFLSSPYSIPAFKVAVKEGKRSVATRIANGGVSFGVGRYVSSYNSLTSLTRNTVASSWMHYLGWKKGKECKYFYSVRGSSYPCAECDSHVGRLYPISEYPVIWHPNCRCIFIFV